MHLLRAQPGQIVDGGDAVDLAQTPADILVLSAADTEISLLAMAQSELPGHSPQLRLANWMGLKHNYSVDVYVERMIAPARLVVVRLLGGRGYWEYGVEQLVAVCREHGVLLALLPGDDQPDDELATLSSVKVAPYFRLWQYLVNGGLDNAREFLAFASDLIGVECAWQEPRTLLRAGPYWPGQTLTSPEDVRAHWREGQPVAAVVFYRALLAAGDLAPVDGLIRSLRHAGINPLPVFCASLKDPLAAATVSQILEDASTELILNATGFAVSTPGTQKQATPFDGCDCPVLQVLFCGDSEQTWQADQRGLSAAQIAMNVALPEVDGRILTRAVAFKSAARFDQRCECQVVAYRVVADRIEFVVALTRAWLDLRRNATSSRRIAIVLANYPNRDGRLGNGVGLDTPAATVKVLRELASAGYRIDDPAGLVDDPTGAALIDQLLAGPTNQLVGREQRAGGAGFSLRDYLSFFAQLPAQVKARVIDRWGQPAADPYCVDGTFRIGLVAFGNVLVAIQPARGYQIDPAATYHDPDLVPPHNYLAFYAWLRTEFAVHAIVHFGKHGNLEWLPGKALALSQDCFPEAVLGPVPHFYPFIVNDPGEGSQAKRRAQAVIVDHLTPPLTRAENYGELAEVELLADEYFEAAGSDPRRLPLLSERLIEKARLYGLDQDCGIVAADDTNSALTKLDAYLCDLKELQIRDGLHVFGCAPPDAQLTAMLVALARVPRGPTPADASLLRALAADLELGSEFDPLDCDFAALWDGPRPGALELVEGLWRHHGDTVERLEQLAFNVVAGSSQPASDWHRSLAVLGWLEGQMRPTLLNCGVSEISGLLIGLDGRFVSPGPSGAPTRGRPEVLPTGRNFYSVDTRMVPTAVAFTLGWKSASLLIERHKQEHGMWPARIALSAWGTANMRTGGDDIAQALALLGVRPTWDTGSGRVSGFEIMPVELLDRPRVDVTLRVSGFFRDAFPAQIALFDSATRAVAALDEPEDQNPLAHRWRLESTQLEASGVSPADAQRRAGFRVFGAKPGAYGAGLQALIDERGWQDDADFAAAFLAWGGYAYGAGRYGEAGQGLLTSRLQAVDAVVHNQDNREHDLLDSDDYYQFEGGLTATVRHLSGRQPAVYHNDHSRPESPRIRTLEEEISRVVRARVINPKWLAGVMRHGYKGAFEMAATVDYLFAFAATAKVVKDHHFDAVFTAYLEDQEIVEFLRRHNPAALVEIAERLSEAIERDLWQPRSNSAAARLAELAPRSAGPG